MFIYTSDILCYLILSIYLIMLSSLYPYTFSVAGIGRSGHTVGDIPGVRFKVVKVAKTSLIALYSEERERPQS